MEKYMARENEMKKKLVVLSGAGMSAESGIETFRNSGGLWEQYNVADVATIQGWRRDRKLVLEFYNKRRKQLGKVEPNSGHYGIAELEKWFDVTVVTQNIDNLHERAGSTNVIHLHGELIKMRSCLDGTVYDWPEGMELETHSACPNGGALRPHIVWFGESVELMPKASAIVQNADIVVVIGTSLQVYPAAGLVEEAGDDIPVYIIDPEPVRSGKHFFHICENATEGVKILAQKLEKWKA